MTLLRRDRTVESVRGIEGRRSRSVRKDARVEIVPFVPDHRPFAEFLEKERIDTVIQCALVADRCGLAPSARAAEIIETMNLGASIAHDGVRVRSWILASSTAVYPIDSRAPMFQRERNDLHPQEGTLAASIAEAEDYARDVAERLPHANVAILRLQHLAGPKVHDSLSQLLARRSIPSPIGLDPLIQLLHIEDAVGAIIFAARLELAGVYNVASAGVLHWEEALCAMDRKTVAALPIPLGPLAPLLDRLGVGCIPADLVPLAWFGHAVDTQKLEHTGWTPKYDQRKILSEISPS